MRSSLLLLLLTVSFAAAGQTAPVIPPAPAKTHFAQHYPKAKAKEWKQGAKHFSIEFDLKGEGYKATYAADGAWVRTEHDIGKSEIPGPVARALKASKYAGWKLEDEEEHSTPEHPVLIRLKVESETHKAELFFLPDGKLLREEVKPRKAKKGS